MSEQIKFNILKALGVELDEEWNAAGDDVAQYRIHEDDTGALIFQFRMPKYSGIVYGSWHDMSGQKYRDASKKLLWFITHPEDMVRFGASTAAQKNATLTMGELRKMEGEPVWVVVNTRIDQLSFWALVEVCEESIFLTNNLGGRTEYAAAVELEADCITIYRRNPEEA